MQALATNVVASDPIVELIHDGRHRDALAACAFVDENDAPKGKPTTVQTFTELILSSRAAISTQTSLTHTLQKLCVRASSQSRAMSDAEASGLRSV